MAFKVYGLFNIYIYDHCIPLWRSLLTVFDLLITVSYICAYPYKGVTLKYSKASHAPLTP